MAIANIIAKGLGFAPGTLYWLFTHGLSAPERLPARGAVAVLRRLPTQVVMQRQASLITMRRPNG